MKVKDFKELLYTLATAWNDGNAQKALDCFTYDAVYIEPPDKQLFKGRDELFIYFKGDNSNSVPMKMKWHTISFDEEKQIGFGEYTFEMHENNHGVAIIELEDDKIKYWREYQWSGNLTYEAFLKVEDKTFAWSVKDYKEKL